MQKSGEKDESSRSGTTLTFNMTHASERGAAARKSQRVTRIAGVEKFVGSRFTPTCNESATRVRLSHNVRAHTATLAAVRPVDRLTRGQIQSRARDLADI